MKEFKKRVREETKKTLIKNAQDASTTRAKRKEYLSVQREESRLKKQAHKMGVAYKPRKKEEDGGDFAARPRIEGLARDAEAPPDLSNKLPRGAVAKKRKVGGGSHGGGGNTPARQLELAQLRQQAMAGYKALKAKKGALEGHL